MAMSQVQSTNQRELFCDGYYSDQGDCKSVNRWARLGHCAHISLAVIIRVGEHKPPKSPVQLDWVTRILLFTATKQPNVLHQQLTGENGNSKYSHLSSPRFPFAPRSSPPPPPPSDLTFSSTSQPNPLPSLRGRALSLSSLNVPRRLHLPVILLRALSLIPSLFGVFHNVGAAWAVPARDGGGPLLLHSSELDYWVAILWVSNNVVRRNACQFTKRYYF
ncbi:hypothetical protein BC936DRAFT_144681 [Jimgerdemannia flammicorona]|uniref:Uncharacterized protein n=1 Tax=Jimgerdemannia flammicorona TaxID=994334 RepID=A0A433DBZ0_9FUNG|nr:hypothetical protein BC936DRAFT_144681 [Jimgerdemannia flammicorona]